MINLADFSGLELARFVECCMPELVEGWEVRIVGEQESLLSCSVGGVTITETDYCAWCEGRREDIDARVHIALLRDHPALFRGVVN